MITYKEFEVIRSLLNADCSAADAAKYVYDNKHYYVFKSADEVAELIASLEKKGFIKDARVTESALNEIEPLKVDNAVILAAGGEDITAKSVYSMPKGLFIKNGESASCARPASRISPWSSATSRNCTSSWRTSGMSTWRSIPT